MIVYILYDDPEQKMFRIWVATQRYNEYYRESKNHSIIQLGIMDDIIIIELLCKYGGITLHKLTDVSDRAFIQMMESYGYREVSQ